MCSSYPVGAFRIESNPTPDPVDGETYQPCSSSGCSRRSCLEQGRVPRVAPRRGRVTMRAWHPAAPFTVPVLASNVSPLCASSRCSAHAPAREAMAHLRISAPMTALQRPRTMAPLRLQRRRPAALPRRTPRASSHRRPPRTRARSAKAPRRVRPLTQHLLTKCRPTRSHRQTRPKTHLRRRPPATQPAPAATPSHQIARRRCPESQPSPGRVPRSKLAP